MTPERVRLTSDPMALELHEVDVFGSGPFTGNPLAVVLGADALTTEQMQRFAHWTNFSETTFVSAPTNPAADYKVRIFTPNFELPFAGHPTLGTCHAWLAAGGQPHDAGVVVQECGAGFVQVRRRDNGLSFLAPPLVRSGPVEAPILQRACAALGIDVAEVVSSAWIDNGPGWLGIELASVEQVLALRPGPTDLLLGVVARHPIGSDEAIEVRAFFPKDGATVEDPVTGSLNASLAQWLLGNGTLSAPYVAAQGTVLGRRGRVHITQDEQGIWVGGATVTSVRGTVEL